MKQIIAAFLLICFFAACRGEQHDKAPDTLIVDKVPPVDSALIPSDSNVLYFPPELLCDTEEYNGQASFLNKWYSKHLFAMREPLVYKNNSQNEIYRFTWLRTFEDPIAIRMERHGNRYALYWKSSSGSGGYEPGKLIIDKQKLISKENWDEFMKRLSQIDFWNLNTHEKNWGMDGAQWILEGKKPTQYHIVDRWTPNEKSDYYECCSFLIDLTDFEIKAQAKY